MILGFAQNIESKKFEVVINMKRPDGTSRIEYFLRGTQQSHSDYTDFKHYSSKEKAYITTARLELVYE